jgi:hypothetical protein
MATVTIKLSDYELLTKQAEDGKAFRRMRDLMQGKIKHPEFKPNMTYREFSSQRPTILMEKEEMENLLIAFFRNS